MDPDVRLVPFTAAHLDVPVSYEGFQAEERQQRHEGRVTAFYDDHESQVDDALADSTFEIDEMLKDEPSEEIAYDDGEYWGMGNAGGGRGTK